MLLLRTHFSRLISGYKRCCIDWKKCSSLLQTLLIKSTLLLAAFAVTSGDRNFPSFATSDLMRHARANQFTEQPYNRRQLRNVPSPRKLRPAAIPDRPNRRPAAPKKIYKGVIVEAFTSHFIGRFVDWRDAMLYLYFTSEHPGPGSEKPFVELNILK